MTQETGPDEEERRAVLYTVGIGAATPDALFRSLRAHGILTLVDIRDRAAGRKGFNRSELESACRRAKIVYVQVRDIGAPAALRKQYDQEDDWEPFRTGYATHLAEHKDAFVALKEHVRAGPTAIVCRCEHPARCERGVVAELFLRAGYGVRHLMP